MKDILNKLKDKFPSIKQKVLDNINILTIYQGILFVISPTPINQMLLIGMIIIFIITLVKKI